MDFFSISVLIWLLNQGGSLSLQIIFSFGMKLWKILSMVLLKRYNCSLTYLFSSNFSLLKVSIERLSNWVLVFAYSQTNGLYNGGYSIFKFNFAYTIWWWQLGCKEAWTPLFMMKWFWLIKIRSMHEDEFGKICVGSQIS